MNDRVVQIGLRHLHGSRFLAGLRVRLQHCCFRGRDGRLGCILICFGDIQRLRAHYALRGQGLGALVVSAGLGFGGLSFFQIGAGSACVSAGVL